MIFHFKEKEIYRIHHIWLVTEALKSCQAINVICNLTTVSYLQEFLISSFPEEVFTSLSCLWISLCQG